jgi:hypothetical protein
MAFEGRHNTEKAMLNPSIIGVKYIPHSPSPSFLSTMDPRHKATTQDMAGTHH